MGKLGWTAGMPAQFVGSSIINEQLKMSRSVVVVVLAVVVAVILVVVVIVIVCCCRVRKC